MWNIKYDHQLPPIGWYTAWNVKPNSCSSTLKVIDIIRFEMNSKIVLYVGMERGIHWRPLVRSVFCPKKIDHTYKRADLKSELTLKAGSSLGLLDTGQDHSKIDFTSEKTLGGIHDIELQ